MTILVTGGAGFIGANFVYYLLKEHPAERVVCVDCLTYAGNLSTLDAAANNLNFVFYKENICNSFPPFLKFLSRNIQILL